MRELTPRAIVAELDRDIVGQDDAKRAVALALRNRWRRQQLSDELRAQVMPKNILLIGPTGVGKTEIARRLAQLVGAPFVKVEATKYTEIGYVGRDVEGMIRDLAEAAVGLVKAGERERVAVEARKRAEDRLLDLLLPPAPPASRSWTDTSAPQPDEAAERRHRSREKLKTRLEAGELEDREVEINIPGRAVAPVSIFGAGNMEQMEMDLQNMFEKIMPKPNQARKMSVRDARPLLIAQETEALLDPEKIHQQAIPWPRNRASSSSTRSTRWPARTAPRRTAPTSPARAFSATSCRSSRARPSTPSTALCTPISSFSLPPAPFTAPVPPI